MARYTAVFLHVVFIGATTNANEAPKKSVEPPTWFKPAAKVDCYSCVSCPQVTVKTSSKICLQNPDVLKVKKCVKYAEKFLELVNGKNVSWVIRGCASERGSCEDIKKAYINNPYLDCTECEGDKCNGVSRSVSDMFFAFFAVVLVPIFGKYILS